MVIPTARLRTVTGHKIHRHVAGKLPFEHDGFPRLLGDHSLVPAAFLDLILAATGAEGANETKQPTAEFKQCFWPSWGETVRVRTH